MMTNAIRFMRLRVPMVVLALALVVGSIAAMIVNGLNYGLEFTGGTLVEVEYSEAQELKAMSQQLEEAGFSIVVAQQFGTETSLVIRLQDEGDDVGRQV